MAEPKDGQQHKDIEDRMVRELEEDIIFGRLKPGARLTEDALLERFGGTRHYVRRALGRLEKLGIVMLRRNRGAAVEGRSGSCRGSRFLRRERGRVMAASRSCMGCLG